MGGTRRLALARPRLLARTVFRRRGGVAGPASPASMTVNGRPARALDRADAERHPLRRVLEPMRFGVAAAVDLVEPLGLDPHPLALEQAEHARLPGLRALVLAVGARHRVVLLVRLRLLVGGDVALVVAQDDLVVRVADQVVGHDRDLAAATGRIDDVGRDRIARGVAAQALHDLDALADGVRKCPAPSTRSHW